jgi:protein ImuA
MAMHAAAQETLCALRREIARIEGVPPERLTGRGAKTPDALDDTAVLVRRDGRGLPDGDLLPVGVEPLDALLGGGLPLAALTEIHAQTARASGVAAGFALALGVTLLSQTPDKRLPLLWLGTAEVFSEAGFPYAAGLHRAYGISPSQLLFAEAPKLSDALWIGEEAARLPDLAGVILELRGNPRMLDLTATRRLHRRARAAGRPVFLLRQSAEPTPTAAPVRLRVEPAPATLRQTLTGPLQGSLGPPGLLLTVDKSRTARPGTFTLEWNPHERRLQARTFPKQSTVPGPVVSPPANGSDLAPPFGQVMDHPGNWRRAAGG